MANRVLTNPWGRIRRWSELGLGLLMPPTCAYCMVTLDCDSIQPQLCSSCEPLFSSRQPSCQRCGAIWNSPDVVKCPDCAARRFAFDEVHSLGAYEGALSDAVLRMKYDTGQSLAFALGRHLGRCMEDSGRAGCFDLAACATKYWVKRLFTGINSPEVIMRGVASQANLSHAADLLVCRRRISKQSMLSPNQRRQNVRDAWVLSDKYDVTGAQILLVDDILTTGATAHEMSKALKRAGAKHVAVAVVGRAKKWQ